MQGVDSVQTLLLMIGIVVLFGSLGGVSGIVFRAKTEKGCEANSLSIKDLVLWAICGIWSAGGIVILGTAVACFFGRQNQFLQWFVLIFLSGISGFFAHRWLPSIAAKFEKELQLVQSQMTELKADNEREISKIKKSNEAAFGYNQALNIACAALRTKSHLELAEAIGRIQPLLEQFSDDRMLHITYARLLRWSNRTTEAIIVLRQYVSRVLSNSSERELNPHERVAIGVAQYNIACYHAILVKEKPNEQQRLMEEIRVALSEAIKYVPSFNEAFRSDEDFSELLKSHPNFFKIGSVQA